MIALKTNREVLRWLCVYPAEENASKWKKGIYAAFGAFILCTNSFAFGASTVYFLRNTSNDLESSLLALGQLAGCANVIYISIITFLMRRKIAACLDSLSKIYNDCKNSLNQKKKNITDDRCLVSIQIVMTHRYDIWFEPTIKVNGCGDSISSTL